LYNIWIRVDFKKAENLNLLPPEVVNIESPDVDSSKGSWEVDSNKTCRVRYLYRKPSIENFRNKSPEVNLSLFRKSLEQQDLSGRLNKIVPGSWHLYWLPESGVRLNVFSKRHENRRVIRVQDYTYNKNLKLSLQSASNEKQLHETCLDFHNLSQLWRVSILFAFDWITCSVKSRSDHLSRCSDSDDWYISNHVFQY
jgi:hypothetical protein